MTSFPSPVVSDLFRPFPGANLTKKQAEIKNLIMFMKCLVNPVSRHTWYIYHVLPTIVEVIHLQKQWGATPFLTPQDCGFNTHWYTFDQIMIAAILNPVDLLQ